MFVLGATWPRYPFGNSSVYVVGVLVFISFAHQLPRSATGLMKCSLFDVINACNMMSLQSAASIGSCSDRFEFVCLLQNRIGKCKPTLHEEMAAVPKWCEFVTLLLRLQHAEVIFHPMH
jgi:hypothetical protein